MLIRKTARFALKAAVIPILVVGMTVLMVVAARAHGGGDIVY